MTDWDDAFENGSYVPNSAGYFDTWQERAASFRKNNSRSDLALSYGLSEREKLDIFWPEKAPKGLVVFIHGGYWLRLDRCYFSDLAAGPLARGWAVAIPSYTLAPDARISEITCQIADAITFAATKVDGPIRITGHSAGGHLVARMICKNSPLNVEMQGRIQNTVPISGVHDLRNLCKTKLNETLQLSELEAALESPCLGIPIKDANVICWVGSAERPEFISQSHLLHDMWQKHDARITIEIDDKKHHFDVIDGLKDPHSPLTKALLD